MNTTRSAIFTTLALGFACILAFGSSSASAADYNPREFNARVSVRDGGHNRVEFAHGGYNRGYEHGNRAGFGFSAQFSPRHYERRWVAPEYRTTYIYGRPVVNCVHEGYWSDIYVRSYDDTPVYQTPVWSGSYCR